MDYYTSAYPTICPVTAFTINVDGYASVADFLDTFRGNAIFTGDSIL